MANSMEEKALQDLTDLVRHEYGLSLPELLTHPDKELKAKRLWRLTGVILKRDYSSPVERRPTRPVGARYRWDIDRKRLEQSIASNSWQVKVLESLQGQREAESLADFAMRLRSETNFGKAFKRRLYAWIGSDANRIRELKKSMRRAGFARFANWLHPERIIGAGAAILAAHLGLPPEQSVLAFAATYGIAATGLDAMREIAGDKSTIKKTTKKSGKIERKRPTKKPVPTRAKRSSKSKKEPTDQVSHPAQSLLRSGAAKSRRGNSGQK